MLRSTLALRFSAAFLALAFLLFLPAGTLRYWQAWVYLAVVVLPLIAVVLYFLKQDPAFLERRMRMREKEKPQERFQILTGILFFVGFLLPGLDFRYGWSSVPVFVVLVADGVVFLGYLLVAFVFRENHYASRIIEVEAGQRVITTGPYAWIRHPMYLGVTLMYLATPLALGSWWSLLVFLLLPLFLAARIRNEEEVLVRELSGYREYCEKVRYRLIPFVW